MPGLGAGPPPPTKLAQDLIVGNIRDSTKAQYRSRIMAFKAYCEQEGTDTTNCYKNTVINYFALLVKEPYRGSTWRSPASPSVFTP